MPVISPTQLSQAFPVDTNMHNVFPDGSKLLKFLKEVLNLNMSVLSRLAALNWVMPKEVVNHFGLDDETIMASFIKLGPQHVLGNGQFDVLGNGPQMSMKLFMFGRIQTCNNQILKKSVKIPWVAKTDKHNEIFDKKNQKQLNAWIRCMNDPNTQAVA